MFVFPSPAREGRGPFSAVGSDLLRQLCRCSSCPTELYPFRSIPKGRQTWEPLQAVLRDAPSFPTCWAGGKGRVCSDK